jgi:hypothetical protein
MIRKNLGITEEGRNSTRNPNLCPDQEFDENQSSVNMLWRHINFDNCPSIGRLTCDITFGLSWVTRPPKRPVSRHSSLSTHNDISTEDGVCYSQDRVFYFGVYAKAKNSQVPFPPSLPNHCMSKTIPHRAYPRFRKRLGHSPSRSHQKERIDISTWDYLHSSRRKIPPLDP